MRTGIFGGSFNPIHNGHIALARQLREVAQLDEVWLMVSPQNPLKHQAQMALKDDPFIKVSDYEFHLPRPSYTWHTLQRLREDFPQHTFILLIGGDNWERFPQWYRADDIDRQYRIVVYPRRGSDIDIAALPPTVTVVEAELLDISSTDIRRRVRSGMPITGFVPDNIVDAVTYYYRNTNNEN